MSDLYLKQTNHRALLEILYRQSKNIKETQPVYSKNNFLQINYWPAYPSSIFFTIEDHGIEFSHSPLLPLALEFVNDLSVMVNNIINFHKKFRLQNLPLKGTLDSKLHLVIRSENCVSIDISYFTGEVLVYIYKKIDKSLGEWFKTENFGKIEEKLEEKVFLSQAKSVCRSLGKTLIQDPLRFSRSFYSSKPSPLNGKVLGFIDLGSILPTDSMGNITIFALKIYSNPIFSELIGYNESDEEYKIELLKLQNSTLKDFFYQSLILAKEKMMLLRVPLMLLAKPELR